MEIVLQGKRFTITRAEVETVREQSPETPQRYVVRIGDKDYPIKQAVSAALRVPPVAFTSQHAYRWLSKLGFEIVDMHRR